MTNIISYIHKGYKIFSKLKAAGINDKLAQKVIDSKGNWLATEVVRLIQSRSPELWISQKRALEIMGKNFFGPEEAIKHLMVKPSEQQLADLAIIPFFEEVLEQSRNTHVLVAVFPLSILEIRSKVERKLFRRYGDVAWYDNAWYDKLAFASDCGKKASWRLVRKALVADFRKETLAEHKALLGNDDETPSARVMTYVIIGHCLATGERLFGHNKYARTSSCASNGLSVFVGNFDHSGLQFIDCFYEEAYSPCYKIGLASARRSVLNL